MTTGSFYVDAGVTGSSLKGEGEKERETERQRQRKPESLALEALSSVAAERHPHRMGENIPCAVPRQSRGDRGHIPDPGTS